MEKEPALRFAEEACELLQAAGMSLSDLIATARWVYAKPAGTVEGEAPDAAIMLSILADQHGLSVTGALDKKLILYGAGIADSLVDAAAVACGAVVAAGAWRNRGVAVGGALALLAAIGIKGVRDRR